MRIVGEGEQFDEASAAALLSDLEALGTRLSTEPLPANKGKDFEAPASALVHQHLKIMARAAASREFWLWLTFGAEQGRFADIVDWRFGARDVIDEVNYGIGRLSQIWEGLFARLWWRGNVGHDPTDADPYDVAKRGDIDLWRSHIIRQEYGRVRRLAVGLVKYQCPTGRSGTTLKVKELRALAKRLRIVDANVAYETLSASDIDRLIETAARQAKDAIAV